MSSKHSLDSAGYKEHDLQQSLSRTNEQLLISKVRAAVRKCKNETKITTNDITKISTDEKDAIVNCLNNNFLKKYPEYFGSRQTIFIDLHN